MDIVTPNFRRLGATPESRKILDLNDKDFDETVKHIGQRYFQLGVVASGNNSAFVNKHVITPIKLKQTPYPSASATEIIAQQRSFAGKIPALVKGVVIAWAIFNFTWLLFALFGML